MKREGSTVAPNFSFDGISCMGSCLLLVSFYADLLCVSCCSWSRKWGERGGRLFRISSESTLLIKKLGPDPGLGMVLADHKSCYLMNKLLAKGNFYLAVAGSLCGETLILMRLYKIDQPCLT